MHILQRMRGKMSSLGVHISLCDVKRLLLPGEYLFAFLDDVYAICMPERTRAVYDLLSEKLLAGAGIRLHTGKTRVWNQAGSAPQAWEISLQRSGAQKE